MIRYALNIFYLLCVIQRKIFCNLAQLQTRFCIELEKFLISKKKKIFNLHDHTVFHQSVFRKIFIKMRNLFAVASVNRRDSSKISKLHQLLFICCGLGCFYFMYLAAVLL